MTWLGRWGGNVAEMRVVAHRPLERMVRGVAVMLLLALGMAGGFWLGQAKVDLDQRYLGALEGLAEDSDLRITDLNRQLVDTSLAREVDHNASQELRRSIQGLQSEIAGLEEEVRFYKSLMAPSSVARGLQIAEFELTATGVERQYSYHILLTQVETRRDWIQGEVEMEVVDENGDRVLSLTDLTALETYPLKFRFRYFQDLTGVLTLPVDFSPRAVLVRASRRGGQKQRLERTFAWFTESRALANG